jgi:predicted DNA-binding transcriptional regulator AlpA
MSDDAASSVAVTDGESKADSTSPFLFEAELRQLLGGCSTASLDRWIRRGRVPRPVAGYPGLRRAWRRDFISAWINTLK